MKISYAQLDAHLTKNLAPIYIVSGEEWILKQEAFRLLRKAAKLAGFNNRIRLAPETLSDWEQLYTAFHSVPLFNQKQLIELDFHNSLPNKTASTLLKEYGNKPSTDQLVLIDMGKIDAKVTKNAWYTALEKAGIVVNIWPIPREQLPQWITNRAKKYQLRFQTEAASLLADYVEGNLVAAAHAIEKIYLLKPLAQNGCDTTPVHDAQIESVTEELIKACVIDESRFTVFDFIEHLVAGNTSRVLHILKTLKAEGVEPILILWGIARELRLLAELAQQLKQGVKYDKLFQEYRIFLRRQAGIRKFLTKFTTEDCYNLLAHAAEMDKTIKGVGSGNVWDSLEMFCLRMN